MPSLDIGYFYIIYFIIIYLTGVLISLIIKSYETGKQCFDNCDIDEDYTSYYNDLVIYKIKCNIYYELKNNICYSFWWPLHLTIHLVTIIIIWLNYQSHLAN
jgi:hypothetical protein